MISLLLVAVRLLMAASLYPSFYRNDDLRCISVICGKLDGVRLSISQSSPISESGATVEMSATCPNRADLHTPDLSGTVSFNLGTVGQYYCARRIPRNCRHPRTWLKLPMQQ